MATTYNELVAEIANWANRSDSGFTAATPTFIALAESDIGRKLRLNQMVALATGTVSANPIDLSSDLTRFRKLKSVSINSGGIDMVLNYISPDLYYARYSDGTAGTPEYYTLVDENLYLDPAPSQEFSYAIVYYQGVAPLTQSNQTNYMLTRYPDLYLMLCMCHASIYLKKYDEAAGFRSLSDRVISEINQESIRDSAGGTARRISEVRAV